MKDKIDQRDLQQAILEVTEELLKEHKAEIIKRARVKLKARRVAAGVEKAQ